ncbi:hypothetical protein ACGFIJ_23290 [Microbispora bryophytorum]|uniref:hypothetical protein n=1 Tax=Microbispora bryophytorum TaxID=1460882 RepID=UPI00372143FA
MTDYPQPETLEHICAEYFSLAFPEADAQWIDSEAASVAERARHAMQALHEPTTRPTRGHMAEALRRLNERGLSPRDATARMRHHELTIETDVVRRPGDRYELRLTVADTAGGYAGTWLALTAGRAGVRYLANVDADGNATFANLPMADWVVELVGDVSVATASIPLPAVRPIPGSAAAATDNLVLVLPNGALFRMNRSSPRAPYVLEITAPSGRWQAGDARPEVYPIRYVSDEDPAALLVPVAPGSASRRSRVHLPGFSRDDRWETTPPLRPEALPPDPDLVTRSIDAAVDRATIRAWRSLVPYVPPDVADIIATTLAEW